MGVILDGSSLIDQTSYLTQIEKLLGQFFNN